MKFLAKLTRFLFFTVFVLVLIVAALFWLPTGSWLVQPAAQYFGKMLTPNLNVAGVEGSLADGYTITGIELVSADEKFLTLDRAAVAVDWRLTLTGNPWVKLVEAEGFNSDVDHLVALAEHFSSDEPQPKNDDSPMTFVMQPLNVAIRDINILPGTIVTSSTTEEGENVSVMPIPGVSLSSLTLDRDGIVALRSRILGLGVDGHDELPVELDGQLVYEPLEILSSDIKLGTARASFKGKVMPPFDIKGNLAALSIEKILELIKGFAPDLELDAAGHINSQFAVTGSDVADLNANGVLSLGNGNIMGVPIDLRVPWSFSKEIFKLDNTNLKTNAAAVDLSMLADLASVINNGDLAGLKIAANGDAKNISLTEIGKMLAPFVPELKNGALTGTGGNVNFDITLDGLDRFINAKSGDTAGLDLSGLNGNFTAELPMLDFKSGSGAGDKIVLKNLKATAKIVAGDADGVLALERSNIAGVPVEMHVPWSFIKHVFKLDDANLKSDAAMLELSVLADLASVITNGDLGGLKITAKGGAKNISLTELGKMFAPDAKLTGTGGNVNFDLALDGLDLDKLAEFDLAGITSNFAANIPNVALAGKQLVKDLNAKARVGGDNLAKLDCTGRVLGAKLFARGSLNEKDKKFVPDFIASLVNLDLATVASAFPELAAVKPQGKINATVKLEQLAKSLGVTGKVTSDKISAIAGGSPMALTNIAANFNYDIDKAIATLNSLAANFNKAQIAASGTANVNKQALNFKATVRNFDPRTVPQLDGLFQGLCDVDATVAGSFTNPKVNVQLKGRDNRAAGVPLGNLNVGVNYANNRVTVPTTKINLPGGSVSLHADVALANDPVLDVNVNIPGLDLARLTQFLTSTAAKATPVTGTVKGDLNIKGPLSAAKVSANLQGDKINVKTPNFDLESAGLNVHHAEFAAIGDMRNIDVKKLDVRFGRPGPQGQTPRARVTGNGKFALNQKNPMDSKFDFNVDVRDIYLNPILKTFTKSLPVSGVLNSKLAFNGTPARPGLDVKITSPLTINQQMDVHNLGLTFKTPEKDHFTLSATGQLKEFILNVDGDVKQDSKKGWTFRAQTRPMDLQKLIATQIDDPEIINMVKGAATVSAGGTIPNDFNLQKAAPITVKVESPKISALGNKINVTKISLPVEYSFRDNHLRAVDAHATLSDGLIKPELDVDLNQSRWTGKVSVRGLDFGKLATPFMQESVGGELVGSADADVKIRGSFGGIAMMFADGSFKTSSGYVHKLDIIDKLTPTKQISFETARGTFFWDGAELYINPGTQILAGFNEPLYRNFGVNGCAGLRGKGLNLLFDGRFDVKMLDQLLGAMKGLFQYAAGNLRTSLLRDAASRILGVKSHDYQNVSFRLANSWEDLQLLDLKIDKPIQDFLPIDMLNKDEEEQRDDRQFKLSLKFPTGPGNPDAEEVSASDQFKQQFIDNLFNIGM